MAFADNTVLFENLGLPSPLGKTRDLVPEGFRGCPPDPCDEAMPDLKDIKGQETAMRSLEVAAASGHHLLLIGPPGAGKSMLARRLPSILPPLEPAEMLEMLEVSMIKSLASDLAGGRISRTRPFRAPHHSASMAALVGDGTRPTPGEAALAHLGVLFLDELPEFNRTRTRHSRRFLPTAAPSRREPRACSRGWRSITRRRARPVRPVAAHSALRRSASGTRMR